jgi:hypothetical protein
MLEITGRRVLERVERLLSVTVTTWQSGRFLTVAGKPPPFNPTVAMTILGESSRASTSSINRWFVQDHQSRRRMT